MAEIPQNELAKRVVYAFLYNVARLADRLDEELDEPRPLKAINRELQVAWFHALRRRGLKLREISDRLGISLASAAKLSKRLKNNFLADEGQVGLARRIQFMVEAEPLSQARIAQALTGVEPAELQAALNALLAAGRIEEVEGRVVRYQAQRSFRVVRDQMLARLDGLNQLVCTIAQVAYARFFRPEAPAFARSVQLRVRPRDMDRLRSFYEDVVWPFLGQLDADAATESSVPLEFVISWSAYDLFTQLDAANSEST